MEYPRYIHHASKASFICPSEEFRLSLEDSKDWYDTRDEVPVIVKKSSECKECLKLKLKINELELKLEATTDLQLEVDRLRIALQMAKKVTAPAKKKAGRPTKIALKHEIKE